MICVVVMTKKALPCEIQELFMWIKSHVRSQRGLLFYSETICQKRENYLRLGYCQDFIF